VTWSGLQLKSGWWRVSNDSDQFLQCVRECPSSMAVVCARLLLCLVLQPPVPLFQRAVARELSWRLPEQFCSDLLSGADQCVGGAGNLCAAFREGPLCANCLVQIGLIAVLLGLRLPRRPAESSFVPPNAVCC
jgi:hypothetical protein